MKNNNIKQKNVLITGINGFVGEKLSLKLREQGANIFGVSTTLSARNILKCDILNYKKIDKFVKQNKIHTCYHLAAASLVESGQKSPYNTFKINTEGTLNMLEIARENNFERIIVASTSHVYGKNKLPHIEKYTPRPSRPYETSKTCADLIAQSYAETFDLPIIIPRFVNIYGPGDTNYTRLIPKTIKNILHDIPPTMWGGTAIRDYLYIDDAVTAYILLGKISLKKIGKNRIFNIGSNDRLSVQELVNKIIFHSGKKLRINKIKPEREYEIKNQYVSWKKAERILGWKPRVQIDDGIKKAIAWYEQVL